MPESTVAPQFEAIDTFAEHPHEGDGGAPKRRMGILFWFAVGWIGLVVFAAILAPVLPLQSTTEADACSTLASSMDNYGISGPAAKLYANGEADSPSQAQEMANRGVEPRAIPNDPCPHPTLDAKVSALPSSRHWLGTDDNGRDTLARLAAGAQVALLVGVVAIGAGMIIGGIIGLIAGHFRGPVEGVLMTIVDIALAYPALVLAIAIVAFRGQSLFNVCLAIGIVSIPAFARIARGTTLTYAEREFVTASRVMGARDRRIIVRELLPNVLLPVLSFALLAVAIAIVAEGGLAFLGLSVPPPQASWGSMIQDGYTVINDAPIVVLIPSIVMFLTVFSFNLVGDRFRELFDVKETVL